MSEISDEVFQIALVSSHGNLFSRNKSLFEGEYLHVTLLCCDSDPLIDMGFVDEVHIFQSHDKCGGSAKELIENLDLLHKLPEFVLLEDDDWLFQISRSNLDDKLKSRLLPIKNKMYFNVAGSKISQVELFSELQINHPRTQIIKDPKIDEVRISFPFIAKGERRSGGVEIALTENMLQLEDFSIRQKSEFLLQEIIPGEEFNADVFYRNGELIFTSISITKYVMWKFGPSARRDYSREVPSEIMDLLESIGKKLQFNGIANVTLMKDAQTKKFYLFEFDSRLNAWAHISESFGFRPEIFFLNPVRMDYRNPRGKVFVNGPRLNKFLNDTCGEGSLKKRFKLLNARIKVKISGGQFIG